MKHIIGIGTGKGGIGKSSLSCLVSLELLSRNYKVGIVDLDIMCPSIPLILNVNGNITGGPVEGLIPVKTKDGLYVFSDELFMNCKSTSVLWKDDRIDKYISNTLENIFFDGGLDYLVLDMAPGTNITLQSAMEFTKNNKIPFGMVIVSEPYKVSINSNSKAITMIKKLKVPIIGIVENKLSGESGVLPYCKENNINYLGRIPYIPEIPIVCDKGLSLQTMPSSVKTFLVPIVDNILEFYGE